MLMMRAFFISFQLNVGAAFTMPQFRPDFVFGVPLPLLSRRLRLWSLKLCKISGKYFFQLPLLKISCKQIVITLTYKRNKNAVEMYANSSRLLCGRHKRPQYRSCPSVCPSVHPSFCVSCMRSHNSKTKRHTKTNSL